MSVIAGVMCGFIGCAPMVVPLELSLRRHIRFDVATGLLMVLVSFGLLTVAMGVVWVASHEAFSYFSAGLVLTYLALWTLETLRCWRQYRDDPPSEGR